MKLVEFYPVTNQSLQSVILGCAFCVIID